MKERLIKEERPTQPNKQRRLLGRAPIQTHTHTVGDVQSSISEVARFLGIIPEIFLTPQNGSNIFC